MGDSLLVDLALSAERLKLLYRGDVQDVVATSRDGRVVRFPANILRPFVDRDGVYGTFRIHYDAGHRLERIERVC